MSLIISAPAKVNLSLSITGRRADGYHLLDSLFVFCGLADKLTIRSGNGTASFKQTGAFAGSVPVGPDNLVRRAAALLAAQIGCPVDVVLQLEKIIPVAAGLGGGSADAAAALNGLNQFWGLNWPMERLEKLAAQLGADVPACIRSQPVIARGVGNILISAPALPSCGLLLVNPRVATPTPAVFKAYAAANPVIPPRDPVPWPPAFGDLSALVDILSARGNDLVQAAIQVTPVIGEVLMHLKALPGVRYAGLSGSGATCFALFDDEEQAQGAHVPPGWWRWSGVTQPAVLS
jgi:4-diphosphocytidyl-2-C-methyl-D-erythritol kinase